MRDGIIVNWLGAITSVREILTELHDRPGHTFTEAVVIIPLRISEDTVKVFTTMLDAYKLDPRRVIGKPVTAVRALGMIDGTIIDIGHGITGMSRLRGRVVDLSTDEPTSGHHMTLVLSRVLGMGYDETEVFRCDPANAGIVFPVMRPTLKKMATIAKRVLDGTDSGKIYLVGSPASLPEAPKVFEEVLGVAVDRPEELLFPTPLGAAMRSS